MNILITMLHIPSNSDNKIVISVSKPERTYKQTNSDLDSRTEIVKYALVRIIVTFLVSIGQF